MRQRAALFAHVHHTNRQDTVPEIGTQIASKANRAGVAEWFADPAVQQSIEVDLTLIDSDEPLLRDLALAMGKPAKQPDANTLSWLQTVPGIGTILRLVLFYERHAIARFPRVQDCVSSCPLVTCAQASAGQRDGTSGTQSGNASLTGAFSAAAVLCLRHHPAGHKSRAR